MSNKDRCTFEEVRKVACWNQCEGISVAGRRERGEVLSGGEALQAVRILLGSVNYQANCSSLRGR
jgi:hypothetical protein